jgi:hypothetical protein
MRTVEECWGQAVEDGPGSYRMGKFFVAIGTVARAWK